LRVETFGAISSGTASTTLSQAAPRKFATSSRAVSGMREGAEAVTEATKAAPAGNNGLTVDMPAGAEQNA
jgi:hypothetical protein